MTRILTAAAIALLLVSCGVARDREKIREGLLSYNLRQDAFLQEWGKPDRTAAGSGPEHIEVSWDRMGGGFFKGKRAVEIWIYEKRKTILYFSGRKLLSGWETGSTVQELSSTRR